MVMSERIQKLKRDGETFIHRESPSKVWRPMIRDFEAETDLDMEYWENCFYYASVARFDTGFALGGGPYAKIGITALDETARHDWRDFQRIKNDVCGPEWEAIELYPAESRLVDPSNRFYLWAVPDGVFAQVGMVGFRRVLDIDKAIAPQRPFSESTP